MKWYSDTNNWARLFEIIGRRNNLNIQYGLLESSSYGKDAPKTFSNMGYAGTKYEVLQGRTSLINNSLMNHNPVIMLGYHDSESAHAWVIDGGYQIRAQEGTWADDPINPVGGDLLQTYYHIIWGDAGYGNGYFLYNVNIGGVPNYSDGYGDLNHPKYGRLHIIYGFIPNR